MIKIGHRGAMGYAPENTIPSFQKAIEQGVDMIEFDVNSCASDMPIVFHDDNLKRLTGRKGLVHKKTLEQIKAQRIDGKHEILTLVEALEFIDKRVKVNLEIKSRKALRQTLHIVDVFVHGMGWSYEDFIISSFSRKIVKRVRKLRPKIKVGALLAYQPYRFLEFAKSIDAYSVHINIHLINKNIIDRAQKMGFKVFVWTVNENHDIKRLKEMGVDGIFSDFPDRL